MEKLSLTRVANILKSEWILLLLGVLSIGMFLLAIFSFSSKNKGPESPTGTPWQGNIYAGKTTKEKLESILGPPEGVEGSGEQTIYKYRSNQEFRPHRVEFTENTIALIKELLKARGSIRILVYWQLASNLVSPSIFNSSKNLGFGKVVMDRPIIFESCPPRPRVDPSATWITGPRSGVKAVGF